MQRTLQNILHDQIRASHPLIADAGTIARGLEPSQRRVIEKLIVENTYFRAVAGM